MGLMGVSGGIGAIASKMLSLFEDSAKAMRESADQFRDSNIAIANPREEAAQIMSSMQETLIGPWARDLTDLARLAAAVHCNVLLMRR